MKLWRLRTVVFAAFLGLYYVSNASAANWDESYDGVILKALVDRGLLPDNIQKKESVTAAELQGGPGSKTVGSNVQRILFLEGADGRSYVAKESVENPDFGREMDLIQSGKLARWKKIVTDYEAAQVVKLPHFIDYLGGLTLNFRGVPSDITLMSKAPGESLQNILEGIESSQISEKEAVGIASEIGQQMGNLTAAFFLKNGTFLNHGDLSEHNLFYDKGAKQLYWIDMGRARERAYTTQAQRALHHEYGSYLDDEANTVKTLWWSFFPFQRRHDVKQFPEAIGARGLDVLKPYRVGVQAGKALFEAYYDRVKNLLPAKEWETDSDAFVPLIKRFTTDYQQAVMDAFGKQEGPRVLSYLFDAKEPDLVADDKKQAEDLEQLRNQTVATLDQKIINDARYNQKDPIYDMLRRKFRYNDYKLTDSRNYTNNLAILEKQSAQTAMKEITDAMVDSSAVQIGEAAQKVGRNFDPKLVEDIKNQLMKVTYDRYVETNQSALDSALRGKIFRK